MKYLIRSGILLSLSLLMTAGAWAQWSSNPAQNLALSDIPGADQTMPKLLALPNNSWYVSWFNNNPNDPPPGGYDVYYQLLNSNGDQQFPHDGVRVAQLTLQSTEDYGLAIDNSGDAVLAFLDDRRDPQNPQVTAAKMSSTGQALWSPNGIALTSDPGGHYAPKVAVTSDGFTVVAWSTDTGVVLQELSPSGVPQWIGPNVFGGGIMLQQSGYYYILCDLHAADNGSVIVSFLRTDTHRRNAYLYANKISRSGQLMWGSGHVHVYDAAPLSFGELPYFTYDGNGGAVFSWDTGSGPIVVYAQHILADGTEAFGHNGSLGTTDMSLNHEQPSVSYNPNTHETFLFWTDTDSTQSIFGVSGQKFNPTGARQWSNSGLPVVPFGSSDELTFVRNVQIGSGALVFWSDLTAGTILAAKLDGAGATLCAQFPVSTSGLIPGSQTAGLAPSGVAALAWQAGTGPYDPGTIYIQNVNPDCTLGVQTGLPQ